MDTTIDAGRVAGFNHAGKQTLAEHPGLLTKFEAERAQATGLASAASGAHERHMAERRRKDDIEANYTREGADGRLSPQVEAEWAERRAAVKREVAEAYQFSSSASLAAARQGDVAEALVLYINQLGNSTVKPVQAKAPKLPSGLPDLIKFHEEKQAERARLAAQRADVESRPKPRAELDAKVEAEIARLLDAQPVRVNFTDVGPALVFPQVSINAAPHRDDDTFNPRTVDLRPLVTRMAGDQILAEARRQIDEHYRGLPAAMSTTEKAKTLAKLDADILAVEIAEVAAIQACRTLGFHIGYRKGVDLRAVLGLSAGPVPSQRR